MMQQGLYFRRDSNEITTVRSGDDALPGDGWEFVDATRDAGLVGARALLVERGLIDRATAARVYWLMPTPRRAASTGPAPAV